MYLLSNAKGAMTHLNSLWRDIITARVPTREMSYRIKKLTVRLNVVEDKLFVKTVKAHAILSECVQLTEQFRSTVNENQEAALRVLTRLEDRVDHLVRKTHEFRIKAG
jgi:hypothetical protein